MWRPETCSFMLDIHKDQQRGIQPEGSASPRRGLPVWESNSSSNCGLKSLKVSTKSWGLFKLFSILTTRFPSSAAFIWTQTNTQILCCLSEPSLEKHSTRLSLILHKLLKPSFRHIRTENACVWRFYLRLKRCCCPFVNTFALRLTDVFTSGLQPECKLKQTKFGGQKE